MDCGVNILHSRQFTMKWSSLNELRFSQSTVYETPDMKRPQYNNNNERKNGLFVFSSLLLFVWISPLNIYTLTHVPITHCQLMTINSWVTFFTQLHTNMRKIIYDSVWCTALVWMSLLPLLLLLFCFRAKCFFYSSLLYWSLKCALQNKNNNFFLTAPTFQNW